MSEAASDGSTEIDVQDLAILVAGMSRFLTRFSALAPFQEAGIGLGEWSALSMIAGKDDITNKQLAHLLGVSTQRVNQITDTLKGADYISSNVAADDGRKKVISITPSGAAQLSQLNAKLQPIVATAFSNRPKQLRRVSLAVSKNLMRIVAMTGPKAVERAATKRAAR